MLPVRSIAVPRPIPVVLSFVAGYVDSCTYLGLFGVFVAQVTGSWTPPKTRFRRLIEGLLAIDQCGGDGTVDWDEVFGVGVLWFARFSAQAAAAGAFRPSSQTNRRML
ncbi:MAG: DUF1275 family protein [Methyloceanibacter sp.]